MRNMYHEKKAKYMERCIIHEKVSAPQDKTSKHEHKQRLLIESAELFIRSRVICSAALNNYEEKEK